MKSAGIFWHIFRREQIKPPLHGHLVYLLEVPPTPGWPVVRNVFDPTGQDFPANIRQKLRAALGRRHNGIVYDGVSKAAAYGLLLVDPVIGTDDPGFVYYNQQVVCNSRLFFLANPNLGLDTMPEPLGRLLQGVPVDSGDLHLQI